ncbi:hypothetical protein B0G84_5704 [Paraburkholderia sp. BL8N3]|nr:hypothetical protein [Paraburkholderia sp. BL8N3]TCK36691.1 hypothetical protein B0G84_5704 [Paraburkholderia sp. BL8N3]
MARIRSIKPEFWTSEQVMELSRDARLCFIGLWNFCDDAGIHPANPKRLKAEVFPGDDHLTSADVRRMIDECIANDLIDEYEIDGERYWSVTGWFHQKIDQPTYKFPRPDGTIPEGAAKRRQSSKSRPPNEHSPSTPGVFAEHSTNARGSSGESPPNAPAPIADQQASTPAVSVAKPRDSSPRDERVLNGHGADDEMFAEHSPNDRGEFAERSPNVRGVFAGCSPPEGKGRERSKPKTVGTVVVSGKPARASNADDDFTPKDAAEWLAHFKRKHGFEADPTSVNDRKKLWPVFAGWVNAGLSAAFVDAAVAIAIKRAREPIACLPLYVDRLMASEQSARSPPPKDHHEERAEVIAGLTGRSRARKSEEGVIDVNPTTAERLAR